MWSYLPIPNMKSFPFSNVVVSLFLFITTAFAEDGRRAYVIHMDESALSATFSSHDDWYTSVLSSVCLPGEKEPTLLYTYSHVVKGFSAVLSETQRARVEETLGHVAAHPETFGEGHTTYTPKFLGLGKKKGGLWGKVNFGKGIIIGVLDSGIWPESKSYRDKGMPPVPERWRGSCENGVEFNSSFCNNKLIGARSFSKGMKQRGENISTTDDYDSPRDYWGHGTHTSSIAAGSPVHGANYFGYAHGTSSGMAPLAHLAMYKVLFLNSTYDSSSTDTLAALDQAIADGVDVISLSLGFIETPFDQNPIAIGAFAAMEKGIFVACSGGNAGPHAYTMLNGAPWLTTVGAATIPRELGAKITLGSGNESFTVKGKFMFPENLLVSRVGLYFGRGNKSKELCESGSLDPNEVAGKIVFCDYDPDADYANPDETTRVGAQGAIFSTYDGTTLKPDDFTTPYVTIVPQVANKIKHYILNVQDPVASIKFQVTTLGTKPNPQVAWFSSRGPDRQTPMLLKPDLIAPGWDVLSSWASNRGTAKIGDHDYLLSDYNLQSGTSMSAPHVAGVGALLKSAHPDWSPAAIRSAMMTTAYTHNNAGGTIIDMTTGVAGTPLDYGSGHIDPNWAVDPGLIYELKSQDYINFLCGLNYNTTQIKTIIGRSNFTCDSASVDLNYPSFIVILNNTNTTSSTFKRVVTNVADYASSYTVETRIPKGMRVEVEPGRLYFAHKGSTAEFSVSVEVDLGDVAPQSDYLGNYGFLTWYEIEGTHKVTSPIVSAFAP